MDVTNILAATILFGDLYIYSQKGGKWLNRISTPEVSSLCEVQLCSNFSFVQMKNSTELLQSKLSIATLCA